MSQHLDANVDLREALSNDRPVGLAGVIQVPTERITTLHGFLLDFDPKLYVPGNPLFPPAEDPVAFFEGIRGVLERHPIVQHAEIRASGTGLHAIVRLEPAVELGTADEQERWAALVRAVQCSLLADPDAPGITALTRAVGSVNSKNGATVTVLKEGQAVAPKAVEEFVARLVAAPFKEVAFPLLGAMRVSPCPLCGKEGSRLDVLDFVGKCYGGCSKVTLGQLYDMIFIGGGCSQEHFTEDKGVGVGSAV
jgi:hypothetical protein